MKAMMEETSRGSQKAAERENRDVSDLENGRTYVTNLSSRNLLGGYCDTNGVIRMGTLRIGLQNHKKVKMRWLLT